MFSLPLVYDLGGILYTRSVFWLIAHQKGPVQEHDLEPVWPLQVDQRGIMINFQAPNGFQIVHMGLPCGLYWQIWGGLKPQNRVHSSAVHPKLIY